MISAYFLWKLILANALFDLVFKWSFSECTQTPHLIDSIEMANTLYSGSDLSFIQRENDDDVIDSSVKSLQALDSLLNAIKLKTKDNLIENSLEDNEDLFYMKAKTMNKKIIYWKVTENGYSYCSVNCLFVGNFSASQTLFKIKEEFQTKTITNDFDQKLNEDKKFSDETLSVLHPSQNLSINESKLKINKTKEVEKLKSSDEKTNYLECLPYVNNTHYDSLKSISKRTKLKSQPEPELITMFDKTGRLEISVLRRKLIKMKQQSINEVILFNRIGNFYRIVGDAYQAIECFRKALHSEPHNSDVLINTARLLYKLKHYEDAIYLTKKSLEYIRPNRLPWLQHFTFAEILKENGYLDEAFLHIQYTLKLKPAYANALKLLKEINHQMQQQQQQQQQQHQQHKLEDKLFFSLLPSSLINYLNSLPSTLYIQLSFHFMIVFVLLVIGYVCNFLESAPTQPSPTPIQDEALSANLSFNESTNLQGSCNSNYKRNNNYRHNRINSKVKKF